MIPIGNSVLYVEPIYLQASSRKLPQLVRVVVANGNEIAMEEDFATALYKVLGIDKNEIEQKTDDSKSIDVPSKTSETSEATSNQSDAELIDSLEKIISDVENQIEKIKNIISDLDN